MRNPMNDPRIGFLKYGIREIVDVAQKIKELDNDFQFIGENIGDPIPKGWPVPTFLKEILTTEINRPGDVSFGYSHSRGLVEARKWVVDYSKKFSPNSTLDYENVLFTSGLGAGIAMMYQMLPPGNRVLQPTPSYPTHTSFESMNAQAETISYQLDPNNDWQPDLADIEAKIQAHPEVSAILVINPNNPTGAVYSRDTLEKIVAIAEKNNLFIICDEIYFRMVYNGHEHVQMTEIAQGRVPLVIMRGMSKDIPWPGGRCGWLEFHNTDLDEGFRAYTAALRQRILLEVCSASLPQFVLTKVYDHPDFPAWNVHYNEELAKNSNQIAETLSQSPYLRVNRTNGAFYMMPLFKDGVLNDRQTLEIKNDAVRAYIEAEVAKPGFPLDKRFTYYLLAATGICVVPASGFFSPDFGFRLTTLDRDETRRAKTYSTIVEMVERYINS